MKLILLSGGSGRRLWPLSNAVRSKQFLKLLKHDGGHESMFQRIWRHLEQSKLNTHCYVSTGKIHAEIMKKQLKNRAPLIIEPDVRDTFPAICLAATFLSSVEKIDLNELVCVLPVDAYADNLFYKVISNLEETLKDISFDLALIGIKPTFPSEKYGYIVIEDSPQINSHIKKISHFTEKPSKEEAINLMENNALWNCGVFVFRLGFIISLIEEMGISTDYKHLYKNYKSLPKRSFDYQVVEKCNNSIVIPFNGLWKDIGTWDTFSETLGKPLLGQGLISDDSQNSHIINELNIPIVISGISNVVIAASPDGILVTEKSASDEVKKLVKGLSNRPLYEERRWGTYSVLDFQKNENGNSILTKKVSLDEGANISYQYHLKRSEHWIITAGEGVIVLDGELLTVKPGDYIHIPERSKHAIKGITALEFIEVQRGTDLTEVDVIRIETSWENTMNYVNLSN